MDVPPPSAEDSGAPALPPDALRDGTGSAVHQPPAHAVLSRDLSHFLVDFSIALHRQAMYPPGHPTLVPTLQSLIRRAETLLEDRARFAIGVARDRLVIDGVVTDVKHPLLRGLADRMHRHQLGAVAFSRGLTTAEIVDLLSALAADPDAEAGPLGGATDERLAAWPHVRAYALRLDRLDIVEDDGPRAPERTVGERPAHRCAQLWVGLAHAAMDGGTADASATPSAEPAALALAIDEHERVEAYDQVIVGYLQQIAEELRAAGGTDALELRKRTSRLVSAMRPDTLRRLLSMGGDANQRQRFLKDAATSMTAGAVVDLVKAASETTQESVSNGLVRMLSKLAMHADAGPDSSRQLAEVALREQVQRLLDGWDLSDPNPAEYTQVLHRISASAPEPRTEGGSAPPSDPIRLVEMSLELDEDAPIFWRAVNDLVERRETRSLADAAKPLHATGTLPERLWTYLTSPLAVNRMLRTVPPDLEGLDAVLGELPVESLLPVFDLLAETEDRALRRALLDRLRRVAHLAGPIAAARLADDRWYVLRNLLHLLSGMERLPDGIDPRPHLSYPDARVRREALRLALRLDEYRAAAVETGLGDEDPSVLGLALTAARRRCPRSAVPRLLDLARLETLDEDLRAHAIRALVAAGRPPGLLDLLLRSASRGLNRVREGTAAGHAALAALSGLASGWRDDPRAQDVIKRAARSNDAEVRLAVRDVA